MRSRKRSLAVAVLVLAGAAGCVNGDASGNQAADALENAGLSREEATCVGNRLEDNLNQEQLNDVAATNDLADLAGQDVQESDEDHDVRELTRGILDRCLEAGGAEGAEGEGEGEGDESDAESDGDSGEG